MKVNYKIWTKLLGVAALKFGNPIESPGKGKRPATRWKHRKLRKFWQIVMEDDDLKTPELLNEYGNNRPPEYGEPTEQQGPLKICTIAQDEERTYVFHPTQHNPATKQRITRSAKNQM